MTSMPGISGYEEPGESVRYKSREQVQETWCNNHKWRKKVKDFFEHPHGINLRHDLMLGLNLITKHSQRIHADDNAEVTNAAREYASRHAIERIRRLVYATLNEVVARKNDRLSNAIRDEMASQWRIQSVINRFVRSCMDVAEFANNMTWIGQLDYALPFFRILASGVVTEAGNRVTQAQGGSVDDINRKMAGKVIEDYVSVVVQIIRHLLVREISFQRIRNIEFATARDRLELSSEKVRRVLGYDGSYKQQRAIDLVLGSIFVW